MRNQFLQEKSFFFFFFFTSFVFVSQKLGFKKSQSQFAFLFFKFDCQLRSFRNPKISLKLTIETGFLKMSRVYVGNLDPRVTERDLEDEFRMFGVLRSVWVARRPPGYAFVEFDDRRDALDAIQTLDGKNGWRVELSHNSKGGGGRGGGRGRGGGEDLKCYECGEPGHFARECRLRIGSRGSGSGRRRSPSPRRRRSPSYDGYGRSPRRRRSPKRRSITPPRRNRSYSRSPPYRARRVSPYANGD